jgi:hypothetical protein
MRIIINRFLNLALFIVACVLTGNGLMLAWRMPHGPGGGRASLLGLNRHDWMEIHMWIAYVVVGLVIVHLAMHWAWLRKVAARGTKWQLAAGLLTGAAIIGVFLCAPLENTRGHQRRGAQTARVEK